MIAAVARSIGTVIVLLAMAVPALAADAGPAAKVDARRHLHIGLGAAVTSLDPHFHRYTPNQTVAFHIFDPLIRLNDRLQLEPALALRWEQTAQTTWRISLRPDVTFHDGQPMTAADVAASLRRPARVSDSPYSRASALAVVEAVTVVDALTLDLHTRHPDPALPHELANLAILPANLEEVDSSAFSDPARLNGTGPYRLVGGSPDDRLILAANKAYWGGAPPWDRITLHVMTDEARRVAALSDGTVDLIEHVPPVDAMRLMTNPGLRVVSRPSTRVLYLGLDLGRSMSPFIAGPHGRPIDNPLRHPSVRHALSLAIDRNAILRDVLLGYGATANQVLAPDVLGHAPELPALAYDLAEARRLMAEAGFADGFSLTLHCPRDRYVADVQVAQTLVRMLGRIQVTATADCMPAAAFFRRASAGEFSLYMAGLAVAEGDGGEALRALLASPDYPGGPGALNRGRWGTPETDDALLASVAATDMATRSMHLQTASRQGMAELGLIPLHIQQSIWAMRDDLEYAARADELTLAQHVHRAFP